jgi:hypothetical protein
MRVITNGTAIWAERVAGFGEMTGVHKTEKVEIRDDE